MTLLREDFRHAFRLFAKSPGFTATAVLTLALALGANSAVFSLVNAALLRPALPTQPGEAVGVFTAREGAERDYRFFSLAEYEALREADAVFTGLAAIVRARAGVSATREDGLDRSLVHLTTANYFSLLGTTPAQGRFYDAAESRPNAHVPVAVASHALWQRLGGRPDFIGSTLWVNGQACTVIGIARPDFTGGSVLVGPELWLPLGMFSQIGSAFGRTGGDADLTRPGNHALLLVGRLQPGLTVAAAQLRLPALAQRLTALQTEEAAGARELQLEPLSRLGLRSQPGGGGEIVYLAAPLLFMAGCVLLIACLNLANMLLARGAGRAREFAVRLALGASRWRIVRQLLVEGLVLAFAGGAVGLLFSHWANQALLASLSSALRGAINASLALQPRLDATVFGFTLLVCVGATLLFGLAPALRASRLDVVSDLKAVGSRSAGRGWNRFFAGRHLLVMAQVALSLVLLFSAGLFLRGALAAGTIPLGFEANDSIVTEMDFSLRNATPAEARRRLAAALERVSALPGVTHAAVSTQAPMNNTETTRRVSPAGAPEPVAHGGDPALAGTAALFTGVTAGYFSTIGVPLLRGRDFTELEWRDTRAPSVAIVDASLARKLFPDGDALGERIRYTGGPAGDGPADVEIVGIVGEHRHEILQVEPTYRIFVPLVHGYTGNVYLHTQVAGPSPRKIAEAVAVLRAELRRLDPDLPVLRHEPLVDFVDRDASLWSARLGAVVFGLFGAIALLLSVMGVYSVKAYAVACRTREIGIRMALGARPADVLALVMRQGAQQIAVACGAGLLLALLVGRALTSLLFHIGPTDPLALAGAVVILGGAALLACYFPARRATKVSPLTALRTE